MKLVTQVGPDSVYATNPIRGILFDYGNTLVQIKDGAEVLGDILADQGYAIDSSKASRGEEVLRRHWNNRYEAYPRGERWTYEIRIDCCRQALRAIGLNENQDALTKLVTEQWASRESEGVYDDVVPTLATLQESRLRLGVLSQNRMSGSELKNELENFGLARYFALVVTSEDTEYDKPDPRFFQTGAAMLGVSNNELWYVGNRYHQDVIGARNAGMTPVLVERGPRHKSRDCISVTSLQSLPNLLRS